jgi:hypothetical protein
MKTIGGRNSFDGHDFAPRDHRQQHDAGVHRAIRSLDVRIHIDECNRACTAITFGTAFFRTGSARRPKPLEKRHIRGDSIHDYSFAVDHDFE